MRIELIPEYEIPDDVHKLANQLLVASFPDYPLARSYYKLLPQFRYLLWMGEHLIVQRGVEYRVINDTGSPARIFGAIDLCVASPYRGQKIATTLLHQVEELGRTSKVDFLILFADDYRLYLKNGYQRVTNICHWKIGRAHV